MTLLSVYLLLVAMCGSGMTHARRLPAGVSQVVDDVSNEVGPNAESNLDDNSGDWVKISVPPTPVVSRRVGQHVELHCEAMGSPPPTIQWYKRNQRLTENESFETESFTNTLSTGLARVASRLVINYVLPRHQDVYRCVAESSSERGPRAGAPSKLIVVDREGREMNLTQLIQAKILGAHHIPRVTFWASTYMDVIGTHVTLPCKHVGNPKPQVIWVDPNGKEIESDEKFSIGSEGELRIRSIGWSDMGAYTCAVENSVGEDSVETFLYPMQESKK